MRKSLLIVAGVAVVAAIGFLALRNFSEWGVASAGAGEVSARAAKELQLKIDDIKRTESAGDQGKQVEVSEGELESYVLYELRDDIPTQLDSIDVQLTPGAIGAETQMTFGAMNTGNPVIDTLVTGTHNLFVKGRLIGAQGRGKFDLDEIRIDGIPVPKILIESLFKKYVKPKYPDADLAEPFDLPWGIEQITLEQGKAKIRY
jgi:hypothetical protein